MDSEKIYIPAVKIYARKSSLTILISPITSMITLQKQVNTSSRSSEVYQYPNITDPKDAMLFSRLDRALRGFHLDKTVMHTIDDDSTTISEIYSGAITPDLLIRKYVNEFWTSKQRNASSLHEISYRACFKPQLPRFFIDRLTQRGDIVYDPFGGRGTTIVETALAGRKGISNDINPLSEIFAASRLNPPDIFEIKERLNEIRLDKTRKADLDLSMFYHQDTLGEIVSLRDYLKERKVSGREDNVDKWIRMTATNRLTGHSSGFFSVYTLPPNQAVTPDRQIVINEKRNQNPKYRNVKQLILKKSIQLLSKITQKEFENLQEYGKYALFVNSDACYTSVIPNSSVQLTVTSPPFLDIVQYSTDNWLRCWFNDINTEDVKITMSKTVTDWKDVMGDVFKELFRITKKGGWVAFEVGDIRGGKVKLDEVVAPLGVNAGFLLFGVLVNQQIFTKTANIWGVSNNVKGTNSNKVVIFYKSQR